MSPGFQFAKTQPGFTIMLFVVCSWMAGCTNRLTGTGLPTLLPTDYVPTAIALTANALASNNIPQPPTASASPTVTITPVSPTATELLPIATQTIDLISTLLSNPEVTQTLTPTINTDSNIPFEDIQIIKPGPLSRVVSPISIHAFLIPGAHGQVRVELLGEDGRLMFRKIMVFDSPDGARVNLYADIDFEILAVAETARLQISVEDTNKRIKALAAESLILLSYGNNDFNPSDDQLEHIVIFQPTEKKLIQGGTLMVSGIATMVGEQPLLVELIASSGKIVGSRLAGISSYPVENYQYFSVEIPYNITSPTWVRLTVTERGERLPGAIHVSSREILLSP
jgi:hypothetical protein